MPPPVGSGDVDLSVPQAAGGHTFAAFIFFTMLGPLATPGTAGGAAPVLFSPVPTPTPTGAPAGNSGSLAAASSSSAPSSGALGATKTLHPGALAPSGGTDWWVYGAIAAALFALALLASVLLGLRRRRTA